MKRDKNHFRGCLIGGAIGDAMGWPVEFFKKDEIIKKYGNQGINFLALNDNHAAEITDDTQMTLFTAEGILRSKTRGMEKGILHRPSVLYYAYQRWLYTQGYPKVEKFKFIYDGWLLTINQLYYQRAPGITCISSLKDKRLGLMNKPVNNSKGCGGVMRMAPVGLFYDRDMAFEMGQEFAALTHGHPTGYIAAGAFAYLISNIIKGKNIEDSVYRTIEKLETIKESQECLNKITLALELVMSNDTIEESINKIGKGWIAEEALAIGIYCSLKYKHDFKNGILTAVNHSGDSDSTGSITGNILGAYLGVDNIPSEWVSDIELKDVITTIADDLLIGYKDDNEWYQKYPGY